MREFERCRRSADHYFAYHSIHKYTEEPFTALASDTVFNIARFLLCWLLRDEEASWVGLGGGASHGRRRSQYENAQLRWM